MSVPYGQGVYGQGLYVGPGAMSVALTTPAYGGTITNPGFTVAWQRTYLTVPAALNDFRVRIYDTDGTTILFDSGTIVSATDAYSLTDDWPAVEGVNLFIRVNVTDVNGYTADSGLSLFQATYTAPPIILDLTVTPVTTGLPHLKLDWTAPVTTGFTGTVQRIYRRTKATTGPFNEAVPAGSWLRIARLTSALAITYPDYNVASGVDYEYAVTQRGTGGGITAESPKQSPPPSNKVEWNYGYLHDPADPVIYTQVLASENAIAQRQQQRAERPRGSDADVLYVGEGYSRSVDIGLIPQQTGDLGQWDRLREMLRRQREGAIYCLRLSTGERIFGNIESDLTRRDSPGLNQPAMRFVERRYVEGV